MAAILGAIWQMWKFCAQLCTCILVIQLYSKTILISALSDESLPFRGQYMTIIDFGGHCVVYFGGNLEYLNILKDTNLCYPVLDSAPLKQGKTTTKLRADGKTRLGVWHLHLYYALTGSYRKLINAVFEKQSCWLWGFITFITEIVWNHNFYTISILYSRNFLESFKSIPQKYFAIPKIQNFVIFHFGENAKKWVFA